MAKSGREKHLSFRRRQQTSNNSRFCIIWINRMINKQVEKRIAEQRSELLLMNHALREEMVAELQEQLRELVAEEARERSLRYTEPDQKQRITSRWLRKIREKYKEKTEEDKENEAKSLDPEMLSFTYSETPSETNSIFRMRKPPKCQIEESLKNLLDDNDTSDVSYDADTSSQPAKCGQQENQQTSADVATVAGTSPLMKGSEEEQISRNPFHATPSFMTERVRCEEERAQVDRTKKEAALLIERRWTEGMDKPEMRENHIKAKPADLQNAEKQGGVEPPVSEKGVCTMKKIKTYLCDLFIPHTSYKWERLEDEDC